MDMNIPGLSEVDGQLQNNYSVKAPTETESIIKAWIESDAWKRYDLTKISHIELTETGEISCWQSNECIILPNRMPESDEVIHAFVVRQLCDFDVVRIIAGRTHRIITQEITSH